MLSPWCFLIVNRASSLYMKFAIIFPFLICIAAHAQIPASSTNTDAVVPSSASRSTDASERFVKKEVPARVSRFETAPVIDGQLNDAVWRSATVFGDFLQTQPGDNIAPSDPTEVMMGYDS